ncbi:MAG: hypothetical protein ISS51_01145 [Dehalococcoidales bacterium]|nr:hypothetical protein [Dehalococcoidales bacterium]
MKAKFIEPGSPWDDGYVESFKRRYWLNSGGGNAIKCGHIAPRAIDRQLPRL